MDETQDAIGYKRCIELSAYFEERGMPNTLLEEINSFCICADGEYIEDQNFFVEVGGDTHVGLTARVVLSSESLPRETLLEACNRINEKFIWLKTVIGDSENKSILFILYAPALVAEWKDLSFSLTEVFMKYVDDACGIIPEIMQA